MTKKDFELIAGVFAAALKGKQLTGKARETVKILVYNMADELEKTNPRFDKLRFIAECNIPLSYKIMGF